MDTNKIMDAYETQMNFVRERNKMKYENKIMKEEDVLSAGVQDLFRKERETEMRIKNIKMQICEEELRQQHEMESYVNNYVYNNLSDGMNVEDLQEEAMQLYYQSSLKHQQDYDYLESLKKDIGKLNK